LGRFRKTPPSIKNHKYNWLFASEWQMVHNRMDGNSFTFFIGMNGSGKSYAMLKRSEILGKDPQDNYGSLFDPDHLENHIFFDRQDLQNKIAELEKMPSFKVRGYILNLDEAQMSTNAKQWNDRDILEFSKEMTSIRSSRFSISLNMPTYKMITTDLRQLGTYICEMYPPGRIDRVNGIAYAKLHLLELKPFLGEVWRHRPFISFRCDNPITGLPQSHGGLLSEFSWDMPSVTVRRNYERLKKDFRKMRSEKLATKNNEKEVKVSNSKRSIPELVALLKGKEEMLKDSKGNIVSNRVSAVLGIGKDKAQVVRSYMMGIAL